MSSSDNFLQIKKKLKKNLERSIEISMDEIQLKVQDEYWSSAMLLVDNSIKLKEPESPKYDLSIFSYGANIMVKTQNDSNIIDGLKINEI